MQTSRPLATCEPYREAPFLPRFGLLLTAALSFAVGGYLMKLSRGMTQLVPTALVFVCFCLGAALQTLAMRDEQMTVTYIIVLGLEALAALILGTTLLEEPLSLLKVTGAALVVAGIVLLRMARA
jgi:multidrug transporter EmrE-like cation transporter